MIKTTGGHAAERVPSEKTAEFEASTGPQQSTVEDALRLAGRGWPVFPCRPGTKLPATQHGHKDASTDETVIRSWWAMMPAANVAVPTGAKTVDVLDIDVRPDGNGWAAFDRLRRAGLLAGAIATVRTPSGGLHVYFRGTEQSCGRLSTHFLDFKAVGGYVLLPPSLVDDRSYVLLDERHDGGGRRLIWETVRALLDPPRTAAPVRRATTGRDVGGLAAWLGRQREGNRNSALYWATCRAVESGHGTDLGELVDAAVQIGLDEREARRTVSSAVRRAGTPT